MSKYAISLFSSSGIGDLGLRANNIQTVSACELLSERMELFKNNFPESECFSGDIWTLKEQIVENYQTRFSAPPFLLLATPPCQGMSPNGMGKMLSDYRKGLRPQMDSRNRLIIPAVYIINQLRPEWIIFENVANMENTIILDENDTPIRILDYIKENISNEYVMDYKVIDCADYGVPQHRKRLITVATRSDKGKQHFKNKKSFIPSPSHGKYKTLICDRWITLKDAIFSMPELCATKGKNQKKDFHPLHKVPVLDAKKIFWLAHTPEGQTAFNNQCVNPLCNFDKNPIHGTSYNSEGINQSNTTTPLYCIKCGALLPRPYVEDNNGSLRIMRGYTSAYKRMLWNEPASTLTQNFQYACSDNKVHPSQNRVLSLYEALIIQTIENYNFSFLINNKYVKDSIIRDTIGESVPPLVIDKICKHILKIIE